MKKIFLLLLALSFVIVAKAQTDPVTWLTSILDKGNGEVELTFKGTIAPTWYVYDTEIPDNGPFPAELNIETLKGATAVGKFKAIDSKAHKKYDDIFGMDVTYYENNVTFAQRLKITDRAAFRLEGDFRSQACTTVDGQCMMLTEDLDFGSADLPKTLVIEAAAPVANQPKETEKPVETAVGILPSDSVETAQTDLNIQNEDRDPSYLWTPVISEVEAFGAVGSTKDLTLLWIFVLGFGGGLIALLTPCVWPMIPMTVSFFLKRNKKDKGKAIREAITYGLAIILIYTLLGLVITAIFGPSALNDLSTSATFNILFFALLVFFAVSFFGAFEIRLPSSWSTKMDSKADSTTGIVSIFFMAFTLALVSFSCTGPVIGGLLVEAASSGSLLAPAIGMIGFSIALAIPFALFAIFPSWLESMPKSGGWLNSVKVVLGFLELALAFKFLSVADLAYGWGILDREVFLVLWIIIFVLLGAYLLGKLKMPHDSDLKHVSVTRLFLSIISLSFALYMVPGLWGAPLKAISAFAPPLYTQDFSLYDGAVHAKFDDYETGMEYAKRNNKPVMIDFSGFGCVNCRKMESSVWIDPRVKSKLENDYVLITLMVDDKHKLPEVMEVEENGSKTKLKTIGDKWGYLQRHKFGTSSQPYYVLLDADGKPIGPSYAYNEDVDKYIQFLNTGLDNFKKKD